MKYINILNKRTGQFNLVPLDNNFGEPVNFLSDLPLQGNSEGECRLVKSLNKIFTWGQNWKELGIIDDSQTRFFGIFDEELNCFVIEKPN